jgi:hypothetical protein
MRPTAHRIGLRGLRTRRRSRGAAMTEAAVSIPVFLLLFAALIFLGKLYAMKGTARMEARSAMWSWALAGCQEGKYTNAAAETVETHDGPSPESVQNDPAYPGGGAELGTEGDDLVKKAEADPKTELALGNEWGVARAVVNKGAVAAPPPFQEWAKKDVVVSMEVQCDEKPRGASPSDVLSFIWSLPETLQLTK